MARLKLPPWSQGWQRIGAGLAAWSGSPQELDLPTLAGAVRAGREERQFLRVEPGIGKLIGVLSLQALPRRVAFDFRDVFSDGFAFDTISATASIARGVARTSDFSMLGTAARWR